LARSITQHILKRCIGDCIDVWRQAAANSHVRVFPTFLQNRTSQHVHVHPLHAQCVSIKVVQQNETNDNSQQTKFF